MRKADWKRLCRYLLEHVDRLQDLVESRDETINALKKADTWSENQYDEIMKDCVSLGEKNTVLAREIIKYKEAFGELPEEGS